MNKIIISITTILLFALSFSANAQVEITCIDSLMNTVHCSDCKPQYESFCGIKVKEQGEKSKYLNHPITLDLGSSQYTLTGYNNVKFSGRYFKTGWSKQQLHDIISQCKKGSLDDADSDPTNELIEDFAWDESTNEITITEAGTDHTITITNPVDSTDITSTDGSVVVTESDNTFDISVIYPIISVCDSLKNCQIVEDHNLIEDTIIQVIYTDGTVTFDTIRTEGSASSFTDTTTGTGIEAEHDDGGGNTMLFSIDTIPNSNTLSFIFGGSDFEVPYLPNIDFSRVQNACSETITINGNSFDVPSVTENVKFQSVAGNTGGEFHEIIFQGENDGGALDTETPTIAQKVMRVQVSQDCELEETTIVENYSTITRVNWLFGNDATGLANRIDRPTTTWQSGASKMRALGLLTDEYSLHIDAGVYNGGGTFTLQAGEILNIEAEGEVTISNSRITVNEGGQLNIKGKLNLGNGVNIIDIRGGESHLELGVVENNRTAINLNGSNSELWMTVDEYNSTLTNFNGAYANLVVGSSIKRADNISVFANFYNWTSAAFTETSEMYLTINKGVNEDAVLNQSGPTNSAVVFVQGNSHAFVNANEITSVLGSAVGSQAGAGVNPAIMELNSGKYISESGFPAVNINGGTSGNVEFRLASGVRLINTDGVTPNVGLLNGSPINSILHTYETVSNNTSISPTVTFAHGTLDTSPLVK